MEKNVLIPVAKGSEDIETVTLIDVFRRAELDVTVASVGTSPQVTLARRTRMEADVLLSEVANRQWDAIVLPGGVPGAEALRDSGLLTEMLKKQAAAERWYGAICAAPAFVLVPHGLLEGRRATCYPAFQDRLPDRSEAHHPVVVDGPCVTSQGPGTAMNFALSWVSLLRGDAVREEVASAMLVQ